LDLRAHEASGASSEMQRRWQPRGDRDPHGPAPQREKPRNAGLFTCAEEDSNLHPLSVDQALNLVTRVSDTSYASRTSDVSRDLDEMDAMDDLDVATDVATAGMGWIPGLSGLVSALLTGLSGQARFAA
jgi:hypothetical protein